MKFMRHKKIVLVCMLVLVVGIGVLNHRLNNDKDLAATAGYTDYELEQMTLHDGDVLVDSLNVTGVPGTSSDAAVDTNAEETAAPAETSEPATVDSNAVIDTIAGAGNPEAVASSVAAIDESLIVTSDDLSELANADAYFEEVRATISMDRNQVISMLTDVIEESKDG
ncbi:MAG TPA: hypothetical protein V6C97_27640, partial [Oculatellaceae cyanobacterium]